MNIATWLMVDLSRLDNGGCGRIVRRRRWFADRNPGSGIQRQRLGGLSVNGGLDFIVNTTTNVDQRRANVLALEDGRFLITYWSREEPGTERRKT